MSLSICIPTFNREKLLTQTLESLLPQLDPRCDKIIISDNCSKDDTPNVVEEFTQKFPSIIYYKWPETVEVGLNLLKCIELANTDFCWLLTDDDVLEKGSIKKVKAVIQNYPKCSGISVNAKGYDCLLKNSVKVRFTHSAKSSKYFEEGSLCLKHLGAWIGYWSAQVIRRDLWQQALKDVTYKKYLGYHHLYLIAKIIKEHSNWYFLSDKCVGYRSNNESFKEEYGIIKRYEIDAVTYLQIYSNFFSRTSKVTKKICKDVINYYLFWQIISLKCNGLSIKNQLKILYISMKSFYNYFIFWFKLLPLIITPKVALLSVRFFYRKFKQPI